MNLKITIELSFSIHHYFQTSNNEIQYRPFYLSYLPNVQRESQSSEVDSCDFCCFFTKPPVYLLRV